MALWPCEDSLCPFSREFEVSIRAEIRQAKPFLRN